MTKRQREQKVSIVRAQLAALELEAKAAAKDTKRTPEEHLQRAIRAGNLRADLRDLEKAL